MGRIWPGLFAFAMICGFYLLPQLMPYLLMNRILGGIAVQTEGYNQPMISTRLLTRRNMVRPHPDMVYGICPYDLTGSSLEITVPVQRDDYWSIAFYNDKAENYYVLTPERIQTAQVSIRLRQADGSGPDQRRVSIEGGAIVVPSSSSRGLVLVRSLSLDKSLPERVNRMAAFDCALSAPPTGVKSPPAEASRQSPPS